MVEVKSEWSNSVLISFVCWNELNKHRLRLSVWDVVESIIIELSLEKKEEEIAKSQYYLW